MLNLVPRVCLGPLGTLGRGPSAEITRRLFSAINVAGTAVSDRGRRKRMGWEDILMAATGRPVNGPGQAQVPSSALSLGGPVAVV